MSCFKCKRTGEKICDAEEAEIRCMICGFCERQAVVAAATEDSGE